MTLFRVLGAIEASAGDHQIDLGGTKRRTVLAAFLVNPGVVLTTEALIDHLWDDHPPAAARSVVHAHLSRIRQLFVVASEGSSEPMVLERRSGGYVVRNDLQRVDLHLFRHLVDRAAAEDIEGVERAALLREAIQLWRGEPLCGLAGARIGQIREGLRRQHVDVAVAWARAELGLGGHPAVIDGLRLLLADHPFAEPLTEALMSALYAAGRGAEALECYEAIRRRLADELGADPGPDLQAVHLAILRAGPCSRDTPVQSISVADPPVTSPVSRSALPAVPRQLPLEAGGFAGRDEELRRLDLLLCDDGDRPPPVVPIAVISGTAGVGKTALAVRWAHRTAGRFPDGQLYVNLRGFGPSGTPATPLEAVRGFLSALQVPPWRIPADPDAQAGLYRSMLAGKRMLIVADNAHDESQVRPLLPAEPSCMVLVTSRRELAGLVTAEGAHPLTLDLLSSAEARDLLAHRLGGPRLSEQPQAVDDIVARCARLPLALAIVAARAAAHRDFSLAALAAELQHTGGSLDPFRGEDAATDLSTVFAWSYRMLKPGTARLFRLLAVHPGPDVTAGAAASLTARALPRARAELSELARAHLITEYAPGRYTVHDLLRTYAGELIEGHDTRTEQRAAVHRVFDYYLHTARAAALLREPDHEPIAVATMCSGVTVERLDDTGQALAWFTAEHLVLLAVIREASGAGYDNHTWQLARTLKTYLQQQGHWHDWLATQQAALEATQRLDNPTGQAIAHRLLGGAHARLGHDDDAEAHLRQAIDLYAHLDDKDGQARTCLSLALALESRGQYRQALDHAQDALALHRMTGHDGGQARALNAIGWIRALLGAYPQALTSCQGALTLIRGTGDRTGEAAVWDSLGYIHRHLGGYLQALDCYQHALVLLEEVGDRYLAAVTLTSLGETHLSTGNVEATTAAWQHALDILEDLDHPAAGPLRIRLREARSG